jgi:hypothetical protein
MEVCGLMCKLRVSLSDLVGIIFPLVCLEDKLLLPASALPT